MAIFLKRLLTLWPALADVSINRMPNSVAFAVASSCVTWLQMISKLLVGRYLKFHYRLSDKSALFPTRTTRTSLPRSARTSSIHLVVDKNEFLSNTARYLKCGMQL